MPRLFPDHLTLDGIQQQLTLLQQGPHRAVPENAVHFPTAKGIYFWYMKPEGYRILSQHITFPEPFNGQTIDEDGNHLVYLGTAGTRKTENNKTGLRERFIWHVCDRHRVSQVRNGTLSTLRQTLGPLFADDLIGLNGVSTEELVNQFMADYLTLTYIAYEGNSEEIKSWIDSDEDKLITTLKPLFNSKKNPNIQALGHPTRQIKNRRNAIKQATILRINQL